MIDYAYYTGRTEAVQSIDVQARVTGYLVSIDFEPGQEVKKGQRLFKIDPRPYQAVFDAAEGQVQLAKARLNLATADLARAIEVAKTPGAISQQELDTYSAAKESAAAAVVAAEANAESARLNLEFTDVKSDCDGIVSRNLIDLGNLVKQDVTLLTTVVSQDPIYAYFNVDERTMLRVERMIREGKITPRAEDSFAPVQLGLADEGNAYPHEGNIDFVDNQVDRSTGTLEVRGKFPNPRLKEDSPEAIGRLLSPGMFVRIRMPIGPPYKALVVPQASLLNDQGEKYLLVVNKDNVVEYRPIEVGPEQPDGTQVVIPQKVHIGKEGRPSDDASLPTVESLQVGDRVIVGGQQRAYPGLTVNPRETDTPAAQIKKTPEPVLSPKKDG